MRTFMVMLMVSGAWLASANVVAQLPSAVVATTERFELRSDPLVALHHFLIDWAASDAGEWPRYAPQLTERDSWRDILDEEERQAWMSAVEAYGTAVGRSLLFDEGMLTVRRWAAAAGERDAIPQEDQALAATLERALPVFERHWWPEHDARNREWIASVVPTLREVELSMAARFERAYGGQWPATTTPVDIMVYANAVGAYSSDGRLTISSAPLGNQMPQAIEMLFHEASHMDELEGPLRAELSAAFKAVGRDEPERFWHDVIFFSSGDITRLALAEHGKPDYQHYGTLGVYRRGKRWETQLPAFESHWRPFLESEQQDADTRRQAMKALVRALGPQQE